MDNWLNSKWFVSGIALALAILLYVFVDFEVKKTKSDASFVPSTSDEQTLTDVPVNIRIDREKFVVSGVPEFVNVSFVGSKSTLTNMVMQRNIEVYVDLEDLGEGTYTVELEYAKVPEDLTVFIEPKTIEVQIEERASDEFTVSVDFINKDQLPEGYELGETKVNPGKVMITSSRSVIKQIAIVKVYIDVNGVTESINNREIPVNVYDSQGNVLNVRIEPKSVVVSVEVNNPSKVVPLEVPTTGKLPEGFTLTSVTPVDEEVEVFATSDVLAEIENVSTKEIDLSTITESGTIETTLDLPEGVRASDDNVQVIIEIEQTRVIENVPIEVINDDELEFSFQEPEDPVMSVTIMGSDKDVSKLTVDDFEISIDVNGLEKGVHQVPVLIDSPTNVDSSVEFEEVTIEII